MPDLVVTSQTLTMPGAQRVDAGKRFYLLVAVVLLLTVIWGFSATYFAPLFGQGSAFGGRIAQLPVIVHLHGWSFFLWYALVVVQTSLIRLRSVSIHRRLGVASLLLVSIMVFTGFVTIAFNIHLTLEHEGPPVWRLYGLAIFMTLVLFVLCYVLAIQYRSDAPMHKRLMLMAAVPAVSSALFRIFLSTIGPNQWNIPVSMMLPALVIGAGMIHDHHVHGRVHWVYLIGLPVFILVQVVAMLAPHTIAGTAVLGIFSDVGELLSVIYGR